ncbi:hypothetical protein AQJ46_47910 [Streptomyces canus]|uniref:Uncharacterized protein n=1 Tax=Streptomyces canus TaxID=58343 RepID=A0A101RKN6_9ACTN|nr:hypothetical protein [Streptomyces canus]KUN57287.1 hypothetical protein AQJ46_47910 [Streptomyces canus]
MYDDNLSLIPEDLLHLSTETAAALGRAWTVKAILSSPLVVHPTGMRVMVHQRDGHVQLTAHVSLSTDPRTPAEKVTARLPLTGHPSTALRAADAIRTRILPRFGCMDAVAALRVLALPLRDAGIPAIAHGSTGRTTVEYRSRDFASTSVEFQPGERRPLKVVIRSAREGHTHADVSIPHLSVPEAARLTASVLPRVYTPVPVPDRLPAEVHELAAQLPGLTARHVVSDVPRLTDLTDPSGHLNVRHFLSVKDTGTRSWAAVGLHNAPIATAYALLSAYAAS